MEFQMNQKEKKIMALFKSSCIIKMRVCLKVKQ